MPVKLWVIFIAPLSFFFSGVNDVKSLRPGSSVLYTWQDPLGKRELVWSGGEKKNQKNELLKDVIDQFLYDPDTPIFYVSFLDGMQRVMLFTEDLVLATKAQQVSVAYRYLLLLILLLLFLHLLPLFSSSSFSSTSPSSSLSSSPFTGPKSSTG